MSSLIAETPFDSEESAGSLINSPSRRRMPQADAQSRANAGPSDSTIARMHWDDDGGACLPPSDVPWSRPSKLTQVVPSALDSANSQQPKIKLIVLPFSEYSAAHPGRLKWLADRLSLEPTDPVVCFTVIDATRVTRVGALLLGLLHAVADAQRQHGRCLVLIGDLCGLAPVSRLTELCYVAKSRADAFAWCREQLGE